jgi:WD40 repeat protein
MRPAALRTWRPWLAAAVLGSLPIEGSHWSAAADPNELRSPDPHSSTVSCLVITPDGKTLVTGSYDNNIKLWDVAARRDRATLRGHPGGIQALALTADGLTLGSTSHDSFVKLWDVEIGRAINTIKTDYRVWCLAFSPDGRTLVTGGTGPLKIWDVATGSEEATLTIPLAKPDKNTVFCSSLAMTSDGKTLCTGHGDRTIRVWDLPSRKLQSTFGTGNSLVESLVFAPGNKTLACILFDQSVAFWDVTTGQQRARIDRALADAWTLAFSPDGMTVAVGGGDGKIRLWDMATGTSRARFPAHAPSRVYALAFTPDGKMLVSGSGVELKRSEVKLWDVSAFTRPRETK